MKIENIKIEKNNWTVCVDGETIHIENTPNILKLKVDDKLQDIYLGGISIDNIRLSGKLSNKKTIKVIIGSPGFKIRCYIFVDNELVLEDSKELEEK